MTAYRATIYQPASVARIIRELSAMRDSSATARDAAEDRGDDDRIDLLDARIESLEAAIEALGDIAS